jgi:multiple sugar transport system ATP-binding protein
MNLLPADLSDGRTSALGGALQLGLDQAWARARKPVTLGVRSENIRIAGDQPTEAKVHDVENHGVEKIVTLRVGDELLRATAPASLDARIDGTVRFGVDAAKVHCFDRASGVSLAYGG